MKDIHQVERMPLFNLDSISDVSSWKASDSHLDARDAFRSSPFRVCDSGGELFTSKTNFSYDARDVLLDFERSRRVYIAAKLLVQEDVALHYGVSNLKDNLLRTHFENATVKDESTPFHSSTLQCDSKGLTASSTTATMRPPSTPASDLARGDSFRATEIRTIVQNHSTSFNESAEMMFPKQRFETMKQHDRWVRALFQSHREAVIQKFVADLELQWPREAPVRPWFTDVDTYINVLAAVLNIVAKFRTQYCN
jgi:hypothetical protein